METKIVLLPPDVGWESLKLLMTILDGVSLRYSNDVSVVVKCRTRQQFDRILKTMAFKKCPEIKWGYGKLIDMLDNDTVVIGPPGSAFIECRSAGYKFISVFDFDLFKRMKFFDLDRIEFMRMNGDICYSADEVLDLLDRYINDGC